jgi:hypothetical protein
MERHPTLSAEILYEEDPLPVAAVGLTQGILGINLQPAGHLDKGKEHIAKLIPSMDFILCPEQLA